MEKSSYARIKNYIYTNLQQHIGSLPLGKIEKEIETVRGLISKIGIDLFSQFLPDKSKLSDLSEIQWEKIQKELETHFDVKMSEGIVIQGKEQQERKDSTWWTGVKKQECDKYYWNRYLELLGRSLPPNVVKTTDVDSDIVMDNIENPEIDKFSRYGMVVGHVQSGKTTNYSALVCKAADSGYKFFVIIAGGTNNLRNQTQTRINESFVGKQSGEQVGAGIGNSDHKRLPISLTTVERDFNKIDADRNSQGVNFDNINVPILLVIKKNTNSLKNVITWLKNQYKNKVANHAMLIIDDESDYASINTKKEDDPTIINKRIRSLLSLFSKSAYVAYTATPYANIFIDHQAESEDLGRDIFPKDFIYSLDAPSNYFGARKVFLDTNNKHLISIDDYLDDIPRRHKKDHELLSIPNSLYDAIRLFIINIAIRSLRGQSNLHNSMLFHATLFTDVHKQLSMHVERYVLEIKKDINAYGRLEDAIIQSNIVKNLKDTFELRLISMEFSWEDVLEEICVIVDTIIVREVHQKTKIPLEYRKDTVTNAIVIGGTSLSRGYTLEGLSVSYFLRNTVFYDTLMQMGRWFGYRPEYEDLCRIYMPQSIMDRFAIIIEATEDLVKDFETMSKANMTPNDFGLAVKQHPDSALQITARNKQRNVRDFIFSMKLDGQAKETGWLSKYPNDRFDNIKAILDIIKKININKPVSVSKSYLWKDIDKNIVAQFLEKFKVYKTDPIGISARMPIGFIKEYVKDRDTNWDVALYGGNGSEYSLDGIVIQRETRKIVQKEGYYEIQNRQVSTGNAESIALPANLRKKLGSDRKATRAKLTNPLLMLHVLETDVDSKLAAFGVSFPGSVLSNEDTIRLRINTVYYENLINNLEYEEESDD